MLVWRKTRLAALAALLLAATVATAQTVVDPGDLAYWQSIQNSTNPAEYSAYLQAYPNGRFAALARLRAAGGTADPAQPAPTQPFAAPAPGFGVPQPVTTPPQPPPQPEPPQYTVAVTPPVGAIGGQFAVACDTLPQTGTSRLIVVPAGTPAIETTSLASLYIFNCAKPQQMGPFAPGNYELRWLTTLFNNEQRLELKAKATFSVR